MNCIKQEDLEVAKVLLEENVEVCGFLLEQETGLVLYVDVVGDEKKNEKGQRLSCQHTKYTKYIFHTHPKTIYSHPSFEDILKVIKERPNNFPKTSIIFSAWGIWEIRVKEKVKVSEEGISQARNLYEKEIHKLYYEKKAVIEVFSSLTHGFNKIFPCGLEITLTPWEKINKEYTLKLP